MAAGPRRRWAAGFDVTLAWGPRRNYFLPVSIPPWRSLSNVRSRTSASILTCFTITPARASLTISACPPSVWLMCNFAICPASRGNSRATATACSPATATFNSNRSLTCCGSSSLQGYVSVELLNPDALHHQPEAGLGDRVHITTAYPAANVNASTSLLPLHPGVVFSDKL